MSMQWFEAVNKAPEMEDWTEWAGPQKPIVPWITHPLHPKLFALMQRLGKTKIVRAKESLFSDDEVNRVMVVTSGLTARAIGSPAVQSFSAIALAPSQRIATGNLNFWTQRAPIGRYFALVDSELLVVDQTLWREVLSGDQELMRLWITQLELCTLSDRMGFAVLSLLNHEMRFKAMCLAWGVYFGHIEKEGDAKLQLVMPVPCQRENFPWVTRASNTTMDQLLSKLTSTGVWVREGDIVRVELEWLQEVHDWMRMTEGSHNTRPRPTSLASLFR